MSTSKEMHRVAREIGHVPVLSVYVDATVTDPSVSRAWRSALASALHAERLRLTDVLERAAFDRAASFVEDGSPPLPVVRGKPGWMAFITPDGPQYVAALPVRVPTLVVWRRGAVVWPYLHALGQRRPRSASRATRTRSRTGARGTQAIEPDTRTRH